VQLLESELTGRLPALPGALVESWPTLRVAVNDDSVGTWFIDAVAGFCVEREMLLDLVIDDQDHTAQRIRDGSVQGAVTTQAASATPATTPTAAVAPVTAAPLPTSIPTEIPLPTVSP